MMEQTKMVDALGHLRMTFFEICDVVSQVRFENWIL
jgi:hypothetical protein